MVHQFKTSILAFKSLSITWWSTHKPKLSPRATNSKQSWSKLQAWKSSTEVLPLKSSLIWKRCKAAWVNIVRWKSQRLVKAFSLTKILILIQSKGYIFLNKEKILQINWLNRTSLSTRWILPIRIIIDQLRVTHLTSNMFPVERIIQVQHTLAMGRNNKWHQWNSYLFQNFKRAIRGPTILRAPTTKIQFLISKHDILTVNTKSLSVPLQQIKLVLQFLLPL